MGRFACMDSVSYLPRRFQPLSSVVMKWLLAWPGPGLFVVSHSDELTHSISFLRLFYALS